MMPTTQTRLDARLTLEGEELCLLPERAIAWPAQRTLLIADPHWGKAAHFRSAAIPVPEDTPHDLARLDRALARSRAHRLIILGDLFHARTSKSPEVLNILQAWRGQHPTLAIDLIRGNHDRHAGDPPPSLGIRCLTEPVVEGPFVLQHYPGEHPNGYAMAGHLHPAVTLVGRGRQRERLACFWFGPRHGILPAFGSFTGLAPLRPSTGDRVFVLAGDEVVAVG